MTTRKYTFVLTPEPDGSAINVWVPAMPGVHTWGRTEDEAIASAREAIALHLEGYHERGQQMPADKPVRRLAAIRRDAVGQLRSTATGEDCGIEARAALARRTLTIAVEELVGA